MYLREISNNLASEDCYELVSKWIGACVHHHTGCQQASTILPTRIMDVSSEDPFLVESNGLVAPYMTLSHCWGSKETLTTTTATLQSRHQRIRLSEFPLTFRDAILLTRKFGIRYLWIDSICIIQDSEEDWDAESRQMKEYYRNSYLTISALQSPDSHHGILIPLRPKKSVKLASEENLYLRPRLPDHREVFLNAILNRRAWALQERLLSTRIVHYGNQEIFWECLSGTARQGSAVEFTERLDVSSIVTSEGEDFKRILTYLMTNGLKESHEIPPIWYRLVTQYSRRQLTRASDRLPAISGLASTMHDATRHTYLAGIWKEDLQDLLWFSNRDFYHKKDSSGALSELSDKEYGYQAPSWSWASIPRPVCYYWRGDETLMVDSERDIQLLESNIIMAGRDSFGRVLAGTIQVHGYTLPLEVNNRPINGGVDDYEYKYNGNNLGLLVPELFALPKATLSSDYGLVFGTGDFDGNIRSLFGPIYSKPDPVTCIALRVAERCSSGEGDVLYCLLLQKVSSDENTWQRIGITRTRSTSLTGDYKRDWKWQKQSLKLI